MDWARLAEAVIRQRRRSGWSQQDLANRSGIASRTVRRLESGREPISEASLLAIEAALGWQYGSAQNVLEGGRPKREVDDDLRSILELWPRIPPRHRAAIRQMAEQLAD